MTKQIGDALSFFIEDGQILDNFAATQIEFNGKLYPTSEQAYQASKFFTTAPDIAERIRLLRSPWEAFEIAHDNKFTPEDWYDSLALDAMREVLDAKFQQHEKVREVLRQSIGLRIVEMNPHDSFWGWGADKKGENWLGKIWMEIREKEFGGNSK